MISHTAEGVQGAAGMSGNGIHSAWEDQESFIQEVLFDLVQKDDEVGKGISIQWNSRRKKETRLLKYELGEMG